MDHSLLDDLRLDAAILRRKQQRKGIEYKVREAPQRPSLHAVAAATAAARSSREGGAVDARVASLSPARPISAPVRLPRLGGDTAGIPASRGTDAGSIDTYDPKALADKEQKRLEDNVTRLRVEASELHYELSEFARKREKLLVELGELQHEDTLEQDRVDGLVDIEAARARNESLLAQLDAVDAYRHTLEHMLTRARNNRVDALETQKAFEESLALNRRELELKENIVLSVLKSRDDEIGELQRMHKRVQAELTDLDRKLAARRHEVTVRQEQARMRNQRRDLEVRLGTSSSQHLTPADIRELQDRVEALEMEVAEARAAKVRAMTEADAAVANFNKIRFAAGVLTSEVNESAVDDEANMSSSASSADESGTGENRPSLADEPIMPQEYPVPDITPLVERFAHVEVEMRQIEEQVADYAQRYKVLRYREAQLQAIKQPKARDERDEAEEDENAVMDALRERGAKAKRAAEAAQNDLKEAEAVKMQLHQSIMLLSQRLSNIAAELPADLDPDDTYTTNLDEVHNMLAMDADRIPTDWCRTLHDKLISTVDHILRLQRSVDPDAVADNVADTRAWLESQRTVRSRRASSAGAGLSIAVAAARAPSPYRVDMPQRASSPFHGTELEATIDKLMVPNECAVRVKPSRAAAKDSHTATAKVLADAAQAFEKQLRDASGRNPSSTASGATDDAHSHAPTSRASAMLQRRNSRLMIAAAYAAVDATMPTHDGDGAEVLLRATVDVPLVPSRSNTARSDPRDLARVNLPKPKPRELHRILASALQMSGDDVDDNLMAKREAEDVITRENLKHTTKVSLKRAQSIQQAKKLVAAAAASATALDTDPPSPDDRAAGTVGRGRLAT